MKKGILNQQELRQVGKAYTLLNDLQAKLPGNPAEMHPDEKSTFNSLIEARNRLGALLKWQDHGGVWKEVSANAATVANLKGQAGAGADGEPVPFVITEKGLACLPGQTSAS